MTLQDTASGVALWRQVADGIERGIADGRFAAGEKLPGEIEIAETYRVNRHTVRRALATLAERGLVRAERGSGTGTDGLPSLAQRCCMPSKKQISFSSAVRRPSSIICSWASVSSCVANSCRRLSRCGLASTSAV